ncbi:hypothetical protein niasHS_014124 [Heterodera schachtii]|uniref:Uncharacterized protein n=1 Tax=Heterodera schachtii TaxID=97005 RepID=A0ABD2IL13_HETSC
MALQNGIQDDEVAPMLLQLGQLQNLQQELEQSEQIRLELEQRNRESNRLAQNEIATLRRALVEQSIELQDQSKQLQDQSKQLKDQSNELRKQQNIIASLLAENDSLQNTLHIFLLFISFVAPPVAVAMKANSRRMSHAETASALIRCTFLCFVLWFPAVIFAIGFVGVKEEKKKQL